MVIEQGALIGLSVDNVESPELVRVIVARPAYDARPPCCATAGYAQALAVVVFELIVASGVFGYGVPILVVGEGTIVNPGIRAGDTQALLRIIG